MDKLSEHAIRMLEIVEGKNDFFRNDNERQADIARAVYDLILQVQMLKMADRKVSEKSTGSNCSEKPNSCVTCAECAYLNVQNTKYLYAICERHGIEFKPFEDDTRTHFCAWGIKADRNCSEKPNDSTISKMEHVEDEPYFRNPTEEEMKSINDYIRSISKPTGVNIFDFMDEPQTEVTTDCRQTKMSLDDAYYLVYKDLTKMDGVLTGKYDAKNGSKQYMNGVWSVMELIAYGVGIDCYHAFNERYSKNMVESMERAERSE